MASKAKTNNKSSITPTQSKDSGMAMVLIFLLIGFWINKTWPFGESFVIDKIWPFGVSTVALILNMIAPGSYKPFAWFWYGLAEILGKISSSIILTIVFIFVVTPVGLLRKLLGKDRLQLKTFKKQNTSALIQRDHLFNKKDITQPF